MDECRDKSRLIGLYNAIANADYPPDADIRINTLENILLTGPVNDISFVLDDRLVVLLEHQSTINLNMPIRFLLFIAPIYERLLDAANLYKRKLVKIPRPEFITLYNGQGDMPDRIVSRSLADYAAIIAKIREYQANGQSLEEAIMNAVLCCKKHGIMKDFLRHRGSEVLNMLNVEFKLEDALAVRFEEGIEKGLEKGLEKGKFEVARPMLAEGFPAEIIKKYTGIDESAILSLR